MTAAAPTLDDLYNDAKAELVNRRPDLTVNDGDISDMGMAAIAAVGDRLVGYAAQLTRATFVDGALGDDLTKLASDHWNITRFPAIDAIGAVTFTRTDTSLAGDIPAGTVVATVQDALGATATFTTDTLQHFAIADAGPYTVNITAVNGGVSGNVQAGNIARINTTLFTTFTVVNANATLGGAGQEDDDALRTRIRTFSTTLRRGTLAALEYGALQVPQVKNSVAVEDSTGIVTVYVADINGASNAAMVSAVLIELVNWRAAGALVNVSGGGLYQLNPISIQLTVRAGINTQALVANVQASITARVAKLKIGEICSRDLIKQAALNVDTDNILACNVLLPAADVAPAANQVIRTDPSFITVS